MITNQTIDKLNRMKLYGMLEVIREQINKPGVFSELSFEERLGLIIDAEWMRRENNRMKRRLLEAKLRQEAVLEDIDFHASRYLSRGQIMQLASCQWIREKRNIILEGATGTGKTFIACALGNKAVRENFSVRYFRLPRLFEELRVARIEGSYSKALGKIAKTDVIILDDWGLVPMSSESRRDLLEILEDRFDLRSTIIATQLPEAQWYTYIGESTIADSILDRVIHNAYRIKLKGESIRKVRHSVDGNIKEICEEEKRK